MTVPVSEVFGPVWQGEGPDRGRLCTFLRTGLCNLSCEWCDTPYTWDRSRYDIAAECPDRDADWIIEAVEDCATDLLVWSGGEPLIHATNPTMHAVLARLRHEVHVETNGTLRPPPALMHRVARWVLSPKIGQDADPWKRKIKPAVLAEWSKVPNAVVKVVCRTGDDVALLAEAVREWGDWRGRVWVMPEGRTADEVTGTALLIADDVAGHGFDLTLRDHVLMYGSERAR